MIGERSAVTAGKVAFDAALCSVRALEPRPHRIVGLAAGLRASDATARGGRIAWPSVGLARPLSYPPHKGVSSRE